MQKNESLDLTVHIVRTVTYAVILILTYVTSAPWFSPAIMFIVTLVLGASLLPKVFEKGCVPLERGLAILEVVVMPVVLIGHYEYFFGFAMGPWVIFLMLLNLTMVIVDAVEKNE